MPIRHHTPLRDVPLPKLPRIVEDPRPVLAAGIALWAVGLIVFGVTRGWSSELVATCLIGMVCGILGWGVYAWQREAVRKGATWVQDGLEEQEQDAPAQG